MSNNPCFIHETRIYEYLSSVGLRVPRYGVVRTKEDISQLPFEKGENVVIKGLASELWHKSDNGALFFGSFSSEFVAEKHNRMQAEVGKSYKWIETLVCNAVDFHKISHMPTEAFVSLKWDKASGMVFSMGFGGILAETWAKELNNGLLVLPVDLMAPEQAFSHFEKHILGRIWLGTLRQGKALVSPAVMLDYFQKIWKLAEILKNDHVELCEINPVVVDKEGCPVALDGVGVFRQKTEGFPKCEIQSRFLLNPETIAIAGVSEKEDSFGRKIFDNIMQSQLNRQSICIIKPGVQSYKGVVCYPDVSYLKGKPVDNLVLALPASIAVNMLEQLINQGGGAEVVYIVAGGIGDGADAYGYAKRIKQLLIEKRNAGKWTPAIIGPNSLGIVLSPLEMNTLFLSESRLPVRFRETGNVALISQSGAFLITRLSSDADLPVKYGFAIGNQMDLKASDLLKVLADDKNIVVVGVYLEGFDHNEGLEFARIARDLIASGKQIVLYKGGRSAKGMKAAQGHTGAMSGDYNIQKNLFHAAGILTAESMREFSYFLGLLSRYPKILDVQSVAVITNAGFEAVACADNIGDLIMADGGSLLQDPQNIDGLQKVLKKAGLDQLVGLSNPLDLTPMADESAYLDSVEFLCEQYDFLILSLVPFTEKLKVFDDDSVDAFMDRLVEIQRQTGKIIVTVIDAGEVYECYRMAFASAGFPVFSSIETPLSFLNLMLSEKM